MNKKTKQSFLLLTMLSLTLLPSEPIPNQTSAREEWQNTYEVNIDFDNERPTTISTGNWFGLSLSLDITTISISTSTPRISHNKYDIHFPKHPLLVRLEAGDLKYLSNTNPTVTIKLSADDLKYLTKINPTTTVDINFNIKWETLCTLAGAIGSVIAIKDCQTDAPYKGVIRTAMSAILLLMPRFHRYMTQTSPQNYPKKQA